MVNIMITVISYFESILAHAINSYRSNPAYHNHMGEQSTSQAALLVFHFLCASLSLELFLIP